LKVLLDARLGQRGLGISTYISRLTEGLAGLTDVDVTVWGPANQIGKISGLRTLAYSGPFDIAPKADPRARGYDVIHYACNLCPLFPGPHSVLTLHDLFGASRGRPRDRVMSFLLMRGLHRATEVVAVSERTRAEAETAYPELTGKVRVIPTGRRTLTRPDVRRTHVLAFSGGSDPRKRVDLMIDVYERYRLRSNAPLPLVVLARAGLTSDQMARLTTLEADIRESATRDDVDALMGSAAALIYPTMKEGFGLPILEAAELGTPVIIDGRADIPAEVRGDHCFSVWEAAADAWVDELERAISVGGLALSINLPTTAEVASRYRDLYESALSR
jgi:alpha-1,3-rhamnosyl/mannosyltransferase